MAKSVAMMEKSQRKDAFIGALAKPCVAQLSSSRTAVVAMCSQSIMERVTSACWWQVRVLLPQTKLARPNANFHNQKKRQIARFRIEDFDSRDHASVPSPLLEG